MKRENPPAKKPSLSSRRLWAFRLLALVLVPLMALAMLEAVLRVVGYGYPTRFLLRAQIEGKAYYVPNEKFGLRFFPAAIARTPAPFRMPAHKPPGTYRIFIFGESAAQGDPDPSFSFGRYLQVLLRARYPQTPFEVVCVAMTAINSHAILPIARECADYDGDLWIVYMGNNEMIGPFGASTVFGSRQAGANLIRANLAAKSTRTGQLLEAVLERFSSRNAPQEWGGLRMFEQNQLHPSDPRKLRVYDNFQKNLEDILRAGRKASVPVLLSTVASNLKDCAPFASLHRQGLDEAQQRQCEQLCRQGATLQDAGQLPEAMTQYSAAAEIDPEWAEIQFRLGQCELALQRTPSARTHFERARDCDALAFRADSRINQIISQTAARHAGQGVHGIDAQKALETLSADGIAGHEAFYEHVHLNFEANYALARHFAEQIAALLPESIIRHAHGDWLTAELSHRQLAASLWDYQRVWQINYSRVSEPPFTRQLNDVPRARMYMARLEQFQSEMNPAAREQALQMYREAVARSPEDTFLRNNFSQFLDSTGDLAAAAAEQQQLQKLLPQFPAPLHRIGILLVRQTKTDEAAAYFERALELRHDYVPALNELGWIRANQQKTVEAFACFKRSVEINPGYIEAYLNLGFLEQSLGNLDRARSWYQQAAQKQPEGPAAHLQRAIELAVAQQRSEALKFFAAAVAMNPRFWQARYLFGVELATLEKIEEAKTQFVEVIRQRPDFAKAHTNLGVALAKQGQLDEALKEFRVALKLNPSNTVARAHAEKIEAMKRQ